MFKTSVVREKTGGFRVHLLFGGEMDSPIEGMDHEALFEASSDAQRLADRIERAGTFDPKHWLWSPSLACAYGFMHSPPTATYETTPRPATRRVTYVD